MLNKGTPLYADDGGVDGLPVVFLHSLAGTSAQWAPQLAHLRANRRAIAFDWRGHGRSVSGASAFSPAAVSSDVARSVDALGLTRFVLVGHSSGALMALEFARTHPERVAGLLLADAAGDFHKIPRADVEAFLAPLSTDEYAVTMEARWNAILTGADASVQRRVLGDMRATPRATVLGVLRELADYDASSALEEYTGPTLAVTTPLNDTPISLQVLQPSLKHVRMTGTSHWLQLDRPAEFNAILDGFLEEVAGVAG